MYLYKLNMFNKVHLLFKYLVMLFSRTAVHLQIENMWMQIHNEVPAGLAHGRQVHWKKKCLKKNTKLRLPDTFQCFSQENGVLNAYGTKKCLLSVAEKRFLYVFVRDDLFQKVERSNRFTWNGRTVLTKTPRLSPKGDGRCFPYCFILRRLIFSV